MSHYSAVTSKCMAVLWVKNCPLQWCHSGCDRVSNHQPHDCFLSRLFRRRSKERPKLCVTGLCAGNSPVTGEFPAQMASYAENVSIWWHHHAYYFFQWHAIVIIPPATKFRGGILDSPCSSVRLSVCLSVRPSVCPSVRPSVGRCPDDNSNSFQWI